MEKTSFIIKRLDISRGTALSMAVAMVAGGVAIILFVSAGGYSGSFEPESASLSSGASSANNAGASGGKYLVFGSGSGTPAPTPTPTATPAPTPTPGGTCITETAPVYPVPAGFPTNYNTGVPMGKPGDTRTKVVSCLNHLPDYTGPMTITASGTVIDGKHIHGTLKIGATAKNVVIKNSYLTVNMGTDSNANAVQTYEDDANVLIVDSEIDAQGSDRTGGGAPLVSRSGYTLLRANVHGSGDIIRIDGHGTVQDSWLHDPKVTVGTQHNDVIQSTNAEYIRILHNTLSNPNGQTSCILLKADIGPISNVVVDGNLMSGGGYTFYWYDSGYKISNGTVTNNRFIRAPNPGGFFTKGGQHGTSAVSATTQPVTSNNVWDDNGTPVGL